MRYEEMLKRAYSQLPPGVLAHKRFELPKPESTIAGARTIFFNFKEICDALNRDPRHLLRFLSREMATSGTVSGGRAIFQGRFYNEALERLVKRYVDDYVTCHVCKRPDTKIVREKRLQFMQCEACGARSSVRPV